MNLKGKIQQLEQFLKKDNETMFFFPPEAVLEYCDYVKDFREGILKDIESYCFDRYGKTKHKRYLKTNVPMNDTKNYDKFISIIIERIKADEHKTEN